MVDRLIGALDLVVPGSSVVTVHSSPDLDDNVVAVLRGTPHAVDVVVLAEDAVHARARAISLGLDVVVTERHSLRGLWTYLRSRALVSTHGFFGCRRRAPGKRVVGLWHGEFGKQIGTFVGEGARHFDWVPVSSELARSVRSAEFALDPAAIHVVGSPRQNLLRDAGVQSGGLGRVVVWAPTYRVSVTGKFYADGDPDALARELPLDDPDLDALLDRYGATLWVRPHPAAAQESGPAGPRVLMATNPALEERGMTFYELLGHAECLITDYSSIWVDFLVLRRPMIAFCPDLVSYQADRGLALEPHEAWFPGEICLDRSAVLRALEEALAGTSSDTRLEERAVQLHTSSGDPVVACWNFVADR